MRCPRARSSRDAGAAARTRLRASGAGGSRRARGLPLVPFARGTARGYADPTPVSPFGPLGLTGPGSRRYALTPASGAGRSAAIFGRSPLSEGNPGERHDRDLRRRAGGRRAQGGVPGAHPDDVRALRRRIGRLQPDAPRRHDRGAGRQPVGVRPRHAFDGARPRASSRTGSGPRRSAGCRCGSPSRCGRATCSRAPRP